MSDAKLDPVSLSRIGEKLRLMYEDLPDGPVPEHLRHLVDLLQDLDRSVLLNRLPAQLADAPPGGTSPPWGLAVHIPTILFSGR